jgi:hypothetical protein
MADHDFSSWPREQEASFVVYERKTTDTARSALMIGGLVGGIVFLLALGIYAGVDPSSKDLSKGMDMSNLTKKDEPKKAEAPKPDPPKAEAAPADKPADKPADPPADKPADK